jgi:uroporphyrinogen-III synthase
VVVTRTREQSSALASQLRGLGADVVELPVIAIEDPADGGEGLRRAAGRLVAGGYAWVACTSTNAASRLLAALAGRTVPGSVRWAAVGPGTAGALARGGITAELVPPVAVSDDLADAFPALEPPGSATVLFPRAESVRGALAEGLRDRGWRVDEVVAYRTVAGAPPPEAVAAAGRAGVIAFTSSSTVERTVDLLGADGVPPLVVTIGPLTTDSARRSGLTVARQASPHTIEGLVAAVVGAVVEAAAAGPDAARSP